MTKGFCNSTILYNKEISSGSFCMGISWKAKAVRPGQFVMLKASRGHDPLLRRPFGIYNVIGAKSGLALKGQGIEILYRVVGRGTGILSMRKPGESVDVLGPLGNGFPSISGKNKKIIFVAGGMGIAQLNLLANTLNPPYPPLVTGGIGGVF
ncbi:MAG: dihydroorotate dehydrogenase electron transfer subunit, partial [Deltaproteobacteria bacterium]|nr:dihydroorotate dehydrogenase electron transfer subunit [Deltaproteobacteria bacterium]